MISSISTEKEFEITPKEEDVLEVYSTAGKLLHSQKVKAKLTTIDLSGLRPGIYVLKLNSLPQVSQRIALQ
ncbi:MAG: T9SS type A sorting domain-containing protein [Crocinitomicaceae bacterium]|nr:T9SS type A sorting domain-containing protein [Crocinitomicaceae bacterium]